MEVKVKWDEEASVWIAINSELGLALESGSYDLLLERVRRTIPELLELNNLPKDSIVIFKTEDRKNGYRLAYG